LERRRLTRPQLGDGDWRFSVSPDGSRLAFVGHEHPGIGDVYVIPMQGGEPHRVTNWNGALGGVVWTPDGRDLIYAKGGLWRISANLAQPGHGTPLKGVSVSANNLSISRPGTGRAARLAFQSFARDLGFRIIDLTAPLHDGVFHSVKSFIAPSRAAFPGPFAPDGSSFAFVSGTPPELWVARSDGTSMRQITSVNVSQLSPGAWSPDGRRIVYDATIEGNTDVFVVEASGGTSKQLTTDASADSAPSWSRDGRWVYFSSTRAGAVPDIWRVPGDGGAAIRVTHNGGLRAWESPDGKNLYYADRNPAPHLIRPAGTARLMEVPTGGGSETALLDGLSPFWWSGANHAVFFIRREPDFDAIERFDIRTHKVDRVGRLALRAGNFGGQLNVSPDGRWALVTEHRNQVDIMLVDNVR
jgi:dipeptidyl aminopeptidase/acylaminoacyl peptidase